MMTPFDSLGLHDRLRELGLSEDQAREIALVIQAGTRFSTGELARRDDVMEIERKLLREIGNLRHQIVTQRREMHAVLRLLGREVAWRKERTSGRWMLAVALIALAACATFFFGPSA